MPSAYNSNTQTNTDNYSQEENYSDYHLELEYASEDVHTFSHICLSFVLVDENGFEDIRVVIVSLDGNKTVGYFGFEFE